MLFAVFVAFYLWSDKAPWWIWALAGVGWAFDLYQEFGVTVLLELKNHLALRSAPPTPPCSRSPGKTGIPRIPGNRGQAREPGEPRKTGQPGEPRKTGQPCKPRSPWCSCQH